MLQCARQLKDVHREVKDLLMKICAREQERCRREEETEEEGDSEGEGISDSDEDWKFLELEVVVATEQVNPAQSAGLADNATV